MQSLVQISNIKDISPVLDLIHDCKFEKDQIRLDSKTSTLEIDFYCEVWEKRKAISKFLFIKKVLVPVMKYTLVISHAEDYQIVGDSDEGPGDDDFFNIITFDVEQNKMWISTIIAKGISVKVRDFDISIVDTDEVTEEKTRLAIFS